MKTSPIEDLKNASFGVRSYIRLFFSLSICIALNLPNSIGQSYPVNVLNVNNGLLSGTVECGLYDSRGFLWVGTRGGLHRYDGKNVVKYLPDTTKCPSCTLTHASVFKRRLVAYFLLR